MIGLGAVTATASVGAEVDDFLDRNWADMVRNDEFADWLREYVPLQHCPRIIVVGKPKSGRTNLLTMLLAHYEEELKRIEATGRCFPAAKRDFSSIQLTEMTLSRDYAHDSVSYAVTEKADLILLTSVLHRRDHSKFTVEVLKNRYGPQTEIVFKVGRMPSRAVQNFVMRQTPPKLTA